MLRIYDLELNSRLWMGSSGFQSPQQLMQAIEVAQCECITLSLKREIPEKNSESGPALMLNQRGKYLLPNTAGCKTAKEAINVAVLAGELFSTVNIKLEITVDDYSLHPNSLALIEATDELLRQGFNVFPYCTEDLAIADKLVGAGCQVLMPWAAPIGSGKGILHVSALRRMRQRFQTTKLIVDAGIGSPADACLAMQLGFDAVLVNSAISRATNPVAMANAMRLAVEAGRQGYKAGLMATSEFAVPTTLAVDRPYWQQKSI